MAETGTLGIRRCVRPDAIMVVPLGMETGMGDGSGAEGGTMKGGTKWSDAPESMMKV